MSILKPGLSCQFSICLFCGTPGQVVIVSLGSLTVDMRWDSDEHVHLCGSFDQRWNISFHVCFKVDAIGSRAFRLMLGLHSEWHHSGRPPARILRGSTAGSSQVFHKAEVFTWAIYWKGRQQSTVERTDWELWQPTHALQVKTWTCGSKVQPMSISSLCAVRDPEQPRAGHSIRLEHWPERRCSKHVGRAAFEFCCAGVHRAGSLLESL